MDGSEAIGLRERKKIKARRTIERVALELVLDRGYDGTTIEEICERAEVSKKTFFNYFPSKAAVTTGRVNAFPTSEQLVDMMEAHAEMCYLDVLVNMISADFMVSGDDEISELRQKVLRSMPQLFFRGQRDLLDVQKAVAEAVGAYLEQHPDQRLMEDHTVGYEALVASSSVTALVRTRSMQHVFFNEPASADDTRRMLAAYLSARD
ncbi:MAG: TetR family transcriptional regulator [Eggerthellaceae bacterium]|nr:TetR family transcriptional regulator [Eggerthellaceae bacterium]